MDTLMSMVKKMDKSKTRLMECITENTGERSKHVIENLILQQRNVKDLLMNANQLCTDFTDVIENLCDAIKLNKTRRKKLPKETVTQLKMLVDNESTEVTLANDILEKLSSESESLTLVFTDDQGVEIERDIHVDISQFIAANKDIVDDDESHNLNNDVHVQQVGETCVVEYDRDGERVDDNEIDNNEHVDENELVIEENPECKLLDMEIVREDLPVPARNKVAFNNISSTSDNIQSILPHNNIHGGSDHIVIQSDIRKTQIRTKLSADNSITCVVLDLDSGLEKEQKVYMGDLAVEVDDIDKIASEYIETDATKILDNMNSYCIQEVQAGDTKVHSYLHIPAKKSPAPYDANKRRRMHYANPEVPCMYCGIMYRKSSLAHHLSTHVEKQLKCGFCTKMFSFRSDLVRHQNTHTKTVKYPCKLCNMVYKAPSSLQAHVKNHHENTRSFICCTCGQQFNERYRMEIHIRRVHEQLRPFVCKICGKSCGDKTNLRYHITKVHGHSISSVKGLPNSLL